MGVKDRLLEFISYKNLSVRMFQYSAGLSNCYVQNIQNGIGPSSMKKISEAYPELNTTWLRTGEGEMLNKEEGKERDSFDSNMIYILPTYAQAGKLSEFANSYQEHDCEKMLSPINDAEMAISITGDSMTPEFPNGSRVLIKRVNEKAFLEWGRTYVLDTCNGIVVKNIYPGDRECSVKCVSINKDYPPFDISISDVYGFWRVLMCISVK